MSQLIGGTVFRNICGERVPLVGAKVFIDHPGPYIDHVFTGENGEWSYLITSGDPIGQYIIGVAEPDGASPGYYLLYKESPSNMNMNFEIEGIDIQTPLYMVDCYDGGPGLTALSPGEATVFAACEEESLLHVYWDVLGELGLEEDCDLTPFPGCARLQVYKSNAAGEITSSTPVQKGGWFSEVDCRDLCSPSAVSITLEPGLKDGYYLFVLQYRCCEGEEPVILDTQQGLVQFVSNPEPVDVDFNFIASLTVDNLNGSDPIDGLEATSDVRPGPALGPLSIGIDANIISGTFLESITYIIEEVDCSAGLNPILLFEQSIPANDGVQPANFLFLDQFLDPDTGEPYFFVNENTIGKCFRATVTVSNVCGEASKSSFFTITESCQFCLVQEQQEVAGRAAFKTKTGFSLNNKEVTIFPNPSQEEAWAELWLATPTVVSLRIRDVSGRVLQNQSLHLDAGAHSIPLQVSGLPSGLYLVEWSAGSEAGLLKLLKE